jgi:hypothetical protein
VDGRPHCCDVQCAPALKNLLTEACQFVWSSGCSAMASLPLASHASFLLWYAMDAKHRLTDRLQRDKSIIHRSSGDVLYALRERNTAQLLVPDNIALLYSTPSLCIGVEPDGKRLGNLSANKLCAVVWDPYDAIVEACRKAQTFLTDDPDRIRSIGTRQWHRSMAAIGGNGQAVRVRVARPSHLLPPTTDRPRLESQTERTSESPCKQQNGAAYRKPVADSRIPSKSFARRRLRPNQARKRSTTQRRGWTAKRIWPACLRTLSTMILVAVAVKGRIRPFSRRAKEQ